MPAGHLDPERAEEALLRRLARLRGAPARPAAPLGQEMLAFFRRDVARRGPKLQALARAWEQLVPDLFHRHTCLESFSGGTLTVLVDSASHLYELKRVLLAGVEKQLLAACRGAGLRRVVLRRGTWTDARGDARFP